MKTIFGKKISSFRNIWFIISLTFICYELVSALSPVTLIQGKITEQSSGKAVQTSIKFFSVSGKQADAKSGDDGTYQSVLTPGETYFVVFKQYFPLGQTLKLSLPSSSSYNEFSHNYSVVKISQGMELYRFNAFDANSSVLSDQAVSNIKELKYFLSFNPEVNLKISVSTADFKQKHYSKKSRHKKTENPDISSARLDTIKKYFQSIGIPLAHHYFEETTKNFDISNNRNKSRLNVIISIQKIMDI